MTTATQNLIDDHVHILRLTDIMVTMAEEQSKEIAHFELVIDLIRNFADGLHHAKEEDLLFPRMGVYGYHPEHGPVAVMLNEHVQGRKHVAGMVAGIEKYRTGNKDGLFEIHEHLMGYAYLLQNHISKENNVLFKMADQAFSDNDQQELAQQFAEIEAGYDKAFNRESAILKINQLAELYLEA